jgi:hypothetical protein
MPRNPEAIYQQWAGTVRLTAEFEVPITGEDDAGDEQTAQDLAEQRLRNALAAAGGCAALPDEARAILHTGCDVTVTTAEPDEGPQN